MKKILISIIIILFQEFTLAQSVNVHLKSGQMIQYPSQNIDYIDFSESTPPALFGFPDSNTYLDTKANIILSYNAPSFGWITDSHWGPDDGNFSTGVEGSARKAHILLNYLKKRVDIGKVLFGGDAYTIGADRYQAAQMLSNYTTDFFSCFGGDGIFCIGNHDCNAPLYKLTKDTNSFIPDKEVYKRTVGLMSQKEIVYDDELLCTIDAMRNDVSTSVSTMAEDEYNNLVAWCKMHFYIDDKERGIRYVILESNDEGYTTTITLNITGFNTAFFVQYDFLAQALKSIPENYHVVVCAHNMYHYANASSYGIGPSGMNVGIILSNFKAKTVCSVSGPGASTPLLQEIFNYGHGNSRIYDFTNANSVKKILCLYGHVHYNESWIIQKTNGVDNPTREYRGYSCYTYSPNIKMDNNAILFVSSNADSYYLDKIALSTSHPTGTVARISHDTLMTTDEHSFDIITLLENSVEFTRIGAGSSRSFEYK